MILWRNWKRNEKIRGDKENENRTIQNLRDTTKAALRGKSQIHNLICLVAQLCPNLCNPMEPTRLLCLWGFSRQEYWSGLPCPAPGDLPNPRFEPRSPTLQWILYYLSHKESPRILEWIAYPFSRGTSWSRNQTGVSCIAGGFFTSWATREAQGR